MQNQPLPLRRSLGATLTCSVYAIVVFHAGSVSAQRVSDAPPAASNSGTPIELSVFEVRSEKGQGYSASSTLAGSRVRTSLVDLAAPITVFTEELFADLGATSLQDIAGYAANVETNYESADAATPTGDGDLRLPNRTRVRGVDSATTTRNYFVSNLRIDSYNMSRLDLSRGPNSILFGLGSPAGVINSTPDRAGFRNARSVEARFDSEGSHRAVLKLNQVLFDQRLALRVNGLHEETELWQKPSLDRQNRGYVALQARPFQATTFNANYERYSNYRRLARSTVIRDGVTPWIAAGRPTWRPGQPVNPAYFAQQAAAFSPMYVNGGGLGPVTAILSRSREVYTKGPEAFATGADAFFYSLSPDIFPTDINFTGHASWAELGGNVVNLALEQRVGRDLSFELAYNREHTTSRLMDLIGFGHPSSQLLADPNELLPDGRPNPNVGRYYIETNPRATIFDNANEGLRLTGSYDLDLTRTRAGWLGRHRISGVVSREESESRNNTAREILTSNHPWLVAAAQNNLSHANRRLVRRFYLDDPLRPRTGQPWARPDYVGLNGEVDGVVSDPFMPGAVANSHAATCTTSFVGVWQAYLWRDRVVGTLGLRRDTQEVFQGESFREANGLFAPAQRMPLPGTPTLKESANTSTRGLAFHATRWLSLYYNEADNYSTAGAAVDVYNRPVPGATGEGRDVGFGVRVPGDRLVFRATKFELKQKGDTANNFRAHFRNSIAMVEDAVAAYAGVPRDPNLGANDLWPIFDQDAKGYEFEVVINPTPDWRILFNAARQKTIQTNIAPYEREYVASRLAVWQPFFDRTLIGSNTTIRSQYETMIRYGLDLAAASDGFQSPRQSEWRFNLVTNYTFPRSSPLHGWMVGGAARWADAPVIGYPNQITAGGDIVPDVSRPFVGDAQFNVDGWLKRQWRVDKDHRFSLQLNVRNLLDEDSLIPQRTTSDGVVRSFQARTPRLFIFSAGLDF